ncbi:MAG: chitobiase/beta-hexosaminidase C-terminal domain-containing protein [Oscillospiraceae bacterium]|nr:chitobiase/beta-hexosaminidase C-terminal domain-containing protein [Oscillospiraceae bacterium]
MMFKRVLSTVLAAALSAGMLCLPANAQSVCETAVAKEYTVAASSVAAPTVNISSGNYIVKEGLKITLISPDGGEIWYSMNGTGFRRYTASLNVTQTSTLRAYSVKNGKQSTIVTYTYNLIPIVSTSHYSGTYNGPQRVFLNCGTDGAKIYYTLDGSTPNERSAVYSASSGILIGNSSTLKIVAIKTGWSKNVRTYNFTIIGGQDVSNDPYFEGGLINAGTSQGNTAGSDSILENYKSKWGYNQLSTTQKFVYERIYTAAKTYAGRVDITALRVKADDFDKAFWAFDYDNPQFLTLGSGYSYYYYPSTGYLQSFTIKYGRTEAEIKSIQQTFDTTVSSVVSAAKNQLSDYAKLKYIHDWIVNHTDYTLNGPAYKSEADGAVVYGKALCEGYSKTFMYMAQELGFDCICVVGSANNSSHMWNMVKLGGVWYHVDVTFDDPIMSNGSKMLSHEYFLLSTYQIRNTHTIDNPINVPTATRSY